MMGMNNHVSPKGILAVLDSDNPKAASTDDQWPNRNRNRNRNRIGIVIINFKDDEALRRPAFDSLSSSSSDGEEEEDEGDLQKSPREIHVSMSGQNELRKSEDDGGWASILQAGKSDVDLPPPEYVHPAVKRSASCLSEKNLELCTESLGSESGSELGHGIEEEDGDWILKETNRFVELSVSKYTKSSATAVTVRPLPPPISSIANGSLRIHSRRSDGRLVLEAVSVPPQRYFRAERGGGRLILSLIRAQSEKTDGCTMEEPLPMITVRKTIPPPLPLPLPANKFTKQNRLLSNEISKERKEEFELNVLQSSPTAAPRLRRTMVPINAYEYFWRKKAGVSAARGGGGGGGAFEAYCIATS